MSIACRGLRGFSLAILFCVFVSLLCVASSDAQVFSTPASISTAVHNSTYPAMAVDALGNINVAWVDSATGINFTRSTNAGGSFLPPVAIPGSIGAAFQPQMIVDPTATIIEIAWAQPSSTAGTFNVFASRSTNSGVSFSTTQVSTTPVQLADSPRLAFAGTGVDVVWGNTGTWISQSAAGVTSFGAPISLATAPQDSGGPRIAVDNNGNIFVAWTDRLAQDQNQAGNYCTNPTGNTDGSGIITVYTNTFGGNYYINETPSGSTPSSAATRNLSNTDWKGPDPSYPNGYYGCSYDSLHLFFDQNDTLHLLWADDEPLEDLLTSTAVSQAGGALKFTFPIGLVGDEGVGSSSVAADSSGSIYVAWAGGVKAPANTEGIYFSRSDNDGTSFFPESTVVTAPGAISPAFPQIAVDSNRNVNIVWEQADQPITAGSSNTFHIFFTHSIDRGGTFPTVREVPTNPSALCIPATPSGTAVPTTPNMTTCGTVQMTVDANSNADLGWVNNSGSSSNIDFSIANVTSQPANDFSINLTSSTPSAFAGQTVTFNVTAAAIGAFNSAITVACNDFPEIQGTQGITVKRSDFQCAAPGPLSPGGAATVSVAIPPNLPANSGTPYSFAINGTSAGTTHRVMASFNDEGSAGSVSPNSATLAVGASANFNININANAFSGTVNFVCRGQPAWIQCGFNPASVNPATSTSSVMTVTVVSAPAGSLLTYPSARGLPAPNHVLWSATFAALCLLTMMMISVGRHQKLRPAAVLRGFGVMALTMVLAVGLVSCGGASSANNSNASGTGSSGQSSGSGGSTSVTATFMVQAIASNGTTNLDAVTITTP